ncbi:tetratricopeptide repeat-containing sensor histidine kinase [Flagellimonas amoyensis]|uniref:tetratricopeptide repeat-containing sensor histidine kinase n=1 Tax=Flagellimonas amoyensis TaxID=2169401 RepID=UPI000D39B0C5|nr:tetratricopeptide repeat-containing sensor histidine kinase [Allomuricauda amoyensis]
MQKFWIVLLTCLFVSCKWGSGDSAPTTGVPHDSVLHYFNQSKQKDLTAEQQYGAINKALYFSKDDVKDTFYLKLLHRKNLILYDLKAFDSLQTYNRNILRQAKALGDYAILGRQYYLMGYYYDQIEHRPDSAFLNYTNAKGSFMEVQDSSWIARSILNMGVIQKNQNDFFGSKETITEAIPYLDAKKDSTYLSICYNTLATNHRKLLNHEEAITYYQMAMNFIDSQNERLAVRNNIATTLMDMGKYGDAVEMLTRISLDSTLVKTSSQYARVLDNLSYAQWLSGNKTEVEEFMSPLEIRQTNKDRRGQIASYTHLGEFYSNDRPVLAKAYFDSVIHLSVSLKAPRAETDALGFLMKLEPNNVGLRDRYIFLQDSLYKEELNVKTQFAMYKYDYQVTQEKSLRLEKENTQKELEVTRQRNQKLVSFFGVAFLLIVLGFLIYAFKQRTKRLTHENTMAKLEATLETEAEMSRRLHDDFGAGLNQAMLMLQGNTDQIKVLDKLEGLYDQSRNFSREINEVDTGSQFKEEFLEMLRYRTPDHAKLLISGSKEVDWEGMDPLAKKVLFKVLQELMINMGKHSMATLVTIGFVESEKILKVLYSDNGEGASEQDLKYRNGLRNTEKRIQAIGGTITFGSGKGEGFKASLVIPR